VFAISHTIHNETPNKVQKCTLLNNMSHHLPQSVTAKISLNKRSPKTRNGGTIITLNIWYARIFRKDWCKIYAFAFTHYV